MKKNKILTKASILLIMAIMIFSSSAVLADTSNPTITSEIVENHKTSSGPMKLDDIVWDNGLGNNGMMSSQEEDAYNLDSVGADDFQFDSETKVGGIFFMGGYWNAPAPDDYEFDWNITFWEDVGNGTEPGAIIYNHLFLNEDILVEKNYNTTGSWYGNYTVELTETLTFAADTKYWVSYQAVGAFPPQSGTVMHNATNPGIKLSECVFKSPFFQGDNNWHSATQVWLEQMDLSFQLIYIPAPELNVTIKGGIGVTAAIENIGDAEATNVSANITVEGGLIIIGGQKTVNIPNIAAEATENAKSFVLGFGNPMITVTVTSDEGAGAVANETKLVLLFLVL